MENQENLQEDLQEQLAGKYDENDIQVLEGLEAVRKRPGMYIGSTDERGLHHLVYEIVDNAVDEALAGFCNEIVITLNRDGSCTVQEPSRLSVMTISLQKPASASSTALSTIS